ncbi:DHHW family protein [Gorillibacterium timonense]|uniref:DHHW family protein n=1 Tax=Gorillibacterium timonense TaxID=1689269 RepID=UPI00071C61E1|nr:DHHW family protein [Gorillibacterium timonense]
MTPKQSKLLSAGFVAILFAAALLFLALPVQGFSETENRRLQAFPQWSWTSLQDKSFTDGIERYISDHFPFRDQWVALKSRIEQLRLQQENNGIFKGKDGYLLETFLEPDYATIAKYTDAIKTFVHKLPGVNIRFLLAPNSIGLNADKLPPFAEVYPEEKVNEYIGNQVNGQLDYLNGFDFLTAQANSEQPLYYRTDHHWTTSGAYQAYRAYAAQMGWVPLAPEDFSIETVTDRFLGSFHTRSQFAGLTPDSIQVYQPKQPVASTMTVVDTGETFDSLYFPDFLQKKDKYSYFLGGVHALVQIRTDLPSGKATNEKLLVIKDSYAHSSIPFLTQHVAEIDVIDIRYYNGSLASYVQQNGITDVLLLFNTSTFVENTDLIKFKR